jgi:phosphatidate cytidylyltransferase
VTAQARGVSEPAAPGADPAARPSRAGRNLRAAIGVGLALGVLILGSVFAYPPAFGAVVVLAGAYGAFELATALRVADLRPPRWLLLVGGATIIAVAYPWGSGASLAALAGVVAAILLWTRAGGADRWLRDAAAGVLAAAYVPFLASFAAILTSPPDGPRRVTSFIATVAFSDIGGYAVGVLSGGKHKMAPRISPGKSWEGFAGSVSACVGVGTLLLTQLLHVRWWQGVLFGLAMAVCAVVGDLAESAIKRDIGVKDMGRLLPGHGGILDRLDSLLIAAPVAWMLLSAFTPPH